MKPLSNSKVRKCRCKMLCFRKVVLFNCQQGNLYSISRTGAIWSLSAVSFSSRGSLNSMPLMFRVWIQISGFLDFQAGIQIQKAVYMVLTSAVHPLIIYREDVAIMRNSAYSRDIMSNSPLISHPSYPFLLELSTVEPPNTKHEHLLMKRLKQRGERF